MKKCLNCGKKHNNNKFCSLSCSASFNNKKRILSYETKQKISNSKKGKKGKKHTDKTKRKLSNIRKEYLKNNSYNWIIDRNLSIPCEYLKNKLKDNNIIFEEEYKVLKNRNFKIDIAFPYKKIGIEINGNQHYKKSNDLILDDYYLERHNLIKNNGWKLVELYYKTVYDENILNIIKEIIDYGSYDYEEDVKKYIISNILCSMNKIMVKQKNIRKRKIKKILKYVKKQKVILMKIRINKIKKILRYIYKYNHCLCGNKKLTISSLCISCNSKLQRKVNRPSYDQLFKDIKELGYSGTGRKYNVSDNAIRKWNKYYENN
jgi:very-short-patch-repair endonuclease